MAKNIVVFSDGTGQEGGKGHDTNIYKLFRMVENRTNRQIAFYDRGLGTGWRKITGNASGMGISKNIKECYRFIFENYSAGDNIFLFGFSRGATTVRSLSSFIHLFGILPKSRPELIQRAYSIYRTRNPKKRDEKAEKFTELHPNMWCRITFLGAWDTVAALGIPIKSVSVFLDKIPIFKHRFQDLTLSKSVTHARHALAIDDERLTFHPAIWRAQLEPYHTMKQVWFCGMHTDVGGGYENQELSDIPLAWMINEAQEHGLRIYPRHKVELSPDQDGEMHDSRGTGLTRLYRRKKRSWDSTILGKPTVHESVTLRKHNRRNFESPEYAPWILDLDYDIETWPAQLRRRGKMGMDRVAAG